MMLHRPFVLLKEKLLLSVACLKESSQQVFERVESTSAVPEEGRSLCHGYCEAMSKAQPSEGAEAERVDLPLPVRVLLGREIVLLLITL